MCKIIIIRKAKYLLAQLLWKTLDALTNITLSWSCWCLPTAIIVKIHPSSILHQVKLLHTARLNCGLATCIILFSLALPLLHHNRRPRHLPYHQSRSSAQKLWDEKKILSFKLCTFVNCQQTWYCLMTGK